MWQRHPEGAEPVSARSPLRARKIMSSIALPVALVGTIVFAVLAMRSGREVWWWEMAIAAAVAVVAAVDLGVLHYHHRRTHR
ncbi:DUF6343 family protein [Nonomuraea sp. NPDC059194]|uniref:DUF6343 family protein n=1 Tax=Nonomuraea sp. NPDC059194 TaxID=3346764 RepID=UPI00367D24A2